MRTAPVKLGYPRGWFAVARSSELGRQRVLARTFMGQPIALFRTAGGAVHATAAHCPHLGAHLGHCGSVEGDSLRCSFHGFRFTGDGTCIATGYGTRPPPNAVLRAWPVTELYGVIFLYHDPAGAPPQWQVPELDMTGWSPLIYHRFSFRGHPQDIAENTVDWGHFRTIHQFSHFEAVEELRFEKERIIAYNRATRQLPFAGATLGTEFLVTVTGLGMSVSDVTLPLAGLRLRQLYFATPTTPDHVDLLAALSVYEPSRSGRIATNLQKVLARTAVRAMLTWIKSDLEKDIKIWQHKIYLEQPALAEGDGPIGQYRRWARQFYAQTASAK